MTYSYLTNCTNYSTDKAIETMTDEAKEVSYQQFIDKVGKEAIREMFPEYDWEEDGGLTLENDYQVAYWYSTYRNQCCYYIEHSRIEHIFIED